MVEGQEGKENSNLKSLEQCNQDLEEILENLGGQTTETFLLEDFF